VGLLSYQEYVRYVKSNAAGGDKFALRQPTFEQFDDDHPRIFLGYYSMPFWMEYFYVPLHVNFAGILFGYRSDAKYHIDQVRKRVNEINGKLTGQALLEEINNTGRALNILPKWPRLEEIIANDRAIADEGPDDPLDEREYADREAFRAGTAAGAPVPDSHGWVVRDASGRPEVGTGKGTRARIRFNPGEDKGAGYRPDENLFHELVHASRDMRGVANYMPVNKGYKNLEEYLATILKNIYLSEKGYDKLLGHYRGGLTLQGAAADNFLHNPQHIDVPPTMLIQNLKDYQPDFYRALVNLPPGRPRRNWVKQYDQEWRALAAQNRQAH
jgi:hypothetical protein